MSDQVFQRFPVQHEMFTVEDYNDTQFALYCEESFVELIEDPNDYNEALAKAVAYERKRLS